MILDINNIDWDLDGLISVKDLPSWKDYWDSCEYFLDADFDLHMKNIFNSLFEAFKLGDKGGRHLALNLPIDEFTTSNEIYENTGIYKVSINENGIVDFYCSTDILFYLFDGLCNKLRTLFSSDCDFYYNIRVIELGLKSCDNDKLYHKECFEESYKECLYYIDMSLDDFVSHLGVSKKRLLEEYGVYI